VTALKLIDRHDITDILLKVALNTITLTLTSKINSIMLPFTLNQLDSWKNINKISAMCRNNDYQLITRFETYGFI
jgi:hypothetical protein